MDSEIIVGVFPGDTPDDNFWWLGPEPLFRRSYLTHCPPAPSYFGDTPYAKSICEKFCSPDTLAKVYCPSKFLTDSSLLHFGQWILIHNMSPNLIWVLCLLPTENIPHHDRKVFRTKNGYLRRLWSSKAGHWEKGCWEGTSTCVSIEVHHSQWRFMEGVYFLVWLHV